MSIRDALSALIEDTKHPTTARAAESLASQLDAAEGKDVAAQLEATIVGLSSVLVSMSQLESEINSLKAKARQATQLDRS